MQPDRRDLSKTVQAMAIARAYFCGGMTKSEVATKFGVSRFKVSRIIEKSLDDGLVEIVFHYPSDLIDYDLSSRLQAKFGLRHALVVFDGNNDDDTVLVPLGHATAMLLSEIVEPDDVLGFAWTRTLEVLTSYLKPLQAKLVVQLGGAFHGAASRRTSSEILRDVARSVKGEACLFYAPLVASDPVAAQAFLRQDDVRAARERYSMVSKALVTIGAWAADQSSVWAAVSPEMRSAGLDAGAVAEICGICFDRQGTPIRMALDDLTIGIDAAALKAIPEVIGVAFGSFKAQAVRAAIMGGVVTSLISHSSLVRELL